MTVMMMVMVMMMMVIMMMVMVMMAAISGIALAKKIVTIEADIWC